MDWKIKKRHSLKKRDVKELREYIEEKLIDDLPLDGEYEKCTLANGWTVILVNKSPSFLIIEDTIIPSLKLFVERSVKDFKRYIIVDMGAVPYLANGADVMAPGVVEIGTFEENEIVFVGDETHEKVLSIGRSLTKSEEIPQKRKGKVVETLHYVGDEFWNFDV
jgi:PUA domain protein